MSKQEIVSEIATNTDISQDIENSKIYIYKYNCILMVSDLERKYRESLQMIDQFIEDYYRLLPKAIRYEKRKDKIKK